MATKREKHLAFAAGTAVAVALAYWVIVGPLLAGRAGLIATRLDLEKKVNDAQRVQLQSNKNARDFRKQHGASMAGSESATESRLFNELRSWSQDTQLTLSSIRPDRGGANAGVRETAFQANGSGSMRALAQFLYRLETTSSPLRIREIQISSKNENSGDLLVDLHVSTLWESPSAPPPVSPVTPSTPAPKPASPPEASHPSEPLAEGGPR